MATGFRGVTVHMGTERARTSAVIAGVAVATIFILVGMLANRLFAVQSGSGNDAMARSDVEVTSLTQAIAEEIPIQVASADGQTSGKGSLWDTFGYALTGVDFSHPITLLGWQIPGLEASGTRLASSNPQEIKIWGKNPPKETIPDPAMRKTVPYASSSGETDNALVPVGQGGNSDVASPLVYIYHTHDRESFLPALPGVTNPDDAYSKDVNITQVGDRLAKELEQLHIPTVHTTVDYWNMGNYANEYAFSRPTVEKELAAHPGLKLIIDMHRDSGPRKETTSLVDGKETAGVFFIIGQQNPNWQKNDALANGLKDVMQKLYPGLCRGVWGKNYVEFDSRYNQDLSPNSVLIEVGGPYNTFSELDLAADDLAHVISSYFQEKGITSSK